MFSTRFCALALAAIGLAGSGGPGFTQAADEFYKGKQLSVMIGYGAGGSDDLWARIISRHIGEYIPGHPTIVPVNTPGAGIRFDPLKLSFVGSPDRDTAVCAANKNAPVKTAQDLYAQELIVGATGSGADTEVYPSFLKNLLGMKFNVISGYPGSRAINLAIERGEVQGICLSYDTIARESIFQSGAVHVLFQAAVKPDPRLAGIPFAADLAKTEQEHQALD